MAGALETNRTLTTIDLRDNDICGEGCKAYDAQGFLLEPGLSLRGPWKSIEDQRRHHHHRPETEWTDLGLGPQGDGLPTKPLQLACPILPKSFPCKALAEALTANRTVSTINLDYNGSGYGFLWARGPD